MPQRAFVLKKPLPTDALASLGDQSKPAHDALVQHHACAAATVCSERGARFPASPPQLRK